MKSDLIQLKGSNLLNNNFSKNAETSEQTNKHDFSEQQISKKVVQLYEVNI